MKIIYLVQKTKKIKLINRKRTKIYNKIFMFNNLAQY